MNIYGEENPYSCCYHPKEIIIGICALCLKERLLILASKQSHFPSLSNISTKDTQTTPFGVVLQRKPSSSSTTTATTTTLPRVFSLGSSFLHRLDSRHHRRPPEDVSDDEDTLPSQDDSFISIKFEDNGKASWDKTDPHGGRDASKSVIEHSKPPARGTLRWRRRIGHLFQLLKWRRPGKARRAFGRPHFNTVVRGYADLD
ncbi:hypothetical protein QJS10_CPB13g00646 [Acorus calamus]|uniref:Uncharacterized protein n=1 Tax=Acorus calamus TaxID=4465 RepID=A0AAV9DHF8_ACOCL|nr:hypothetical protein QJS10_CPB13g00646 [Acorus calamus]